LINRFLALGTVWLINLERVISQHKKTHGGVCHENSNLGGMYSSSNNSNTLLGYATGFKVGYLIFYAAVYFVANKLCQKWDERKGN